MLSTPKDLKEAIINALADHIGVIFQPDDRIIVGIHQYVRDRLSQDFKTMHLTNESSKEVCDSLDCLWNKLFPPEEK